MRVIARVLGLCGLCGVLAAPVPAQRAGTPAVRVDREGVMRWTATGKEVALFGVNYAAPFAYDYQSIRALGLDPKRAMDADVSHLARLGVDAYRIHVWDREVTDTLGNLLENEHLDLFDYLLSRLEARGIKVILTPIAWWGPGYPAPDHPSPGFANRFSKPQMLVDSVARRASVRYVAQFVQHRNPYTGKRYGDDPNIIAMEIFNEPWHDLAPPRETTRYINEMVASMRGAGLRTPIFYNISEHWTPEHGAAVCAADIQGVSAQWYPTGLVRGEALPGNPLPNVDRYPLPWKETPGCASKAHMVYEFDGADVTVPVMYPAMARAFRGAGFQWATQFAYDPMAVAYSNTEYQTHFLNLIYMPAKAISFLIAGEVFRQTARGFDAGTYPASERWGKFRVSYAERLSEYVSDTMFAYTGFTETLPPDPRALRHIAGVGTSMVVGYSGSGAYFLDRLAEGVWRLEVYPDVVAVEDPHSRGNLQRAVSRIHWREEQFSLLLPDLGAEFTIAGIGAGNAVRGVAKAGRIDVRPGVYLLARAGVDASGFRDTTRFGGRRLDEFHAPPSSEGTPLVRHEPPPSIARNAPLNVSFDVVRPTAPDSVLLFVRQRGWRDYTRVSRLIGGLVDDPFTYHGTLRVADLTGVVEYVVTTFDEAGAVTYPGAITGRPDRWDFASSQQWAAPVVEHAAPVVLFDGDRDRSRIVEPGYIPGVRWRSESVASSLPERNAWRAVVDTFGPASPHVAFRTMLRRASRARLSPAMGATGPFGDALRVRWRSTGPAPARIEVALILSDGSAWGSTVEAPTAWGETEFALADLSRVPLVLLPRPYPTFLPYDLRVGGTPSFALERVEGIQWGIPRPAGAAADPRAGLEVEWVQLVQRPQR